MTQVDLALTVNGRKRKRGKKDFLSLSENLGLKEKQVRKVFKRFPKAMSKALIAIGHYFLRGDKAETYQLLVQDRAERLSL